MVYLAISCRCLLAGVFVISAVTKLRSPGSFRKFRVWLKTLPLPIASRHSGAVAAAMATAEVLIVVLIALPWTVLAGFALAGATLCVFVIGTAMAIGRGSSAPCECFGSSGAPLAAHHVVRDAILLAVAVAGGVSSGTHGARAAGIAMSVVTALVMLMFVVFLDDLLSLVGSGPSARVAGR